VNRTILLIIRIVLLLGGTADMALQFRLGLLSEWWAGTHRCGYPHFAGIGSTRLARLGINVACPI
jgi:hypothetical protein